MECGHHVGVATRKGAPFVAVPRRAIGITPAIGRPEGRAKVRARDAVDPVPRVEPDRVERGRKEAPRLRPHHALEPLAASFHAAAVMGPP